MSKDINSFYLSNTPPSIYDETSKRVLNLEAILKSEGSNTNNNKSVFNNRFNINIRSKIINATLNERQEEIIFKKFKEYGFIDDMHELKVLRRFIKIAREDTAGEQIDFIIKNLKKCQVCNRVTWGKIKEFFPNHYQEISDKFYEQGSLSDRISTLLEEPQDLAEQDPPEKNDTTLLQETFSDDVAEPSCLKLHFRYYRALTRSVENMACRILIPLSSPVMKCLSMTRKITVIDYCYTTTIRCFNKLYISYSGKELVNSENIQTNYKREKNGEIPALQHQLGLQTIYPQFCRITASYINDFIPQIIGQQLSILPSFVEGLVLYRLGITARYIDRQGNKHLDYRTFLRSSPAGKFLLGNYNGIKNRTAILLTGKENLEQLVNFEHILLEFCLLFNSHPDSEENKTEKTKNWTALLLKSLAKSLSNQNIIDTHLNDHGFKSEEEKFIGRLEWYHKQGSLPQGLPNPSTTCLTIQNLQDQLDIALYDRVRQLIANFLTTSSPQSLTKNDFLGIFYRLEGKDILTETLTNLIIEFGIKQIADPHLFAIAILQSNGIETTDYELNAFGRMKGATVLEVGQAMMGKACAKAPWDSIVDIYSKSGLRTSVGGVEGILQQRESKEKLKAFITQLIYDMIKDESLQKQNGVFKAVREKASFLPVIGMPTVCLHFLINGMFFSYGYLFRDSKMEQTSFFSWMIQNFSGKNFCGYLAGKIVDLIYHPSWRITILEALDMVLEVNAGHHQNKDIDTFTLDDFKPITNFVFQFFIEGSESLFKGNISSLFDYFTGDKIFEKLNQFVQPTNMPSDSLPQNILQSLLPTIKELHLYTKVIMAFRCEKVCFDGDGKFWEIFIREALNQFVTIHFMNQKKPSLEQKVKVRNKHVEKMLKMNDLELREFLSKIRGNLEIDLDEWVNVSEANTTVACSTVNNH